MSDFGQLFRSTEELESPIDASITGTIPDWLAGSFLRVGPGKFDLAKDFTLNHWCDGYAVIYKFDINDGKVQFNKKFLRSDAYNKAVTVGRPVFTEFGTRAYPDPCKNVFSRMMSTLVPDMTDNDGQNIFAVEDSLYVSTETALIRNVDPETLDTSERVDLSKLIGVNLISSHALKDGDNNIYTIGTSLITGFKYHVIKISPAESKKASDAFKKASIITTIPSRWKSCVGYYHSFGMSDNYIVLIEQPMLMNGMKLLATQVKGKAMKDCMEWRPNELNMFHVINKSTGKVLPLKFQSDTAFFIFHHINTYEKDNQLIVDIIGQDSPEVVDKMFLKNLRMSDFDLTHKATARRFVLPLGENIKDFQENQNLVKLPATTATAMRIGDVIKVTSETLTEPGYEMPTVNKACCGKEYKYIYVVGLYDQTMYRNNIVKINPDTKEVLTWKESDLTFPGEVIFVPRPDSKDEDDGVLLSGVTDLRPGHSDFLLVLDAKNLTEIGRAEVNAHVPHALHGMFLSR